MKKFLTYFIISVSLMLLVLPKCAFSLEELQELEGISGNVVRTTLDNGMVVVIKQMADKDIAVVNLLVKSGSTTEGEFSGSGISHFVEHMVFKGTPTRPKGEIQRQMKSLGATFNGYTTHDYTGYAVSVEAEYFPKVLEILADSVMNPLFDVEELEKERNVILREIALNYDDADRYFSRFVWSSVYTIHPYRYPVIGYEEVFKKLERKDLVKYHKQKYIPNNMVLAITSPDLPSVVLDRVGTVFGNFPRKSIKPLVLPKEPEQISFKEYSKQRDIELTRLAISYHSTPINHSDLFAMDLLAAILGQGESSHLNQNITKKGIVYSAASYNYTPMHPGIFIISATLNEEKLEIAKIAIFDEIEKIKNKKVTREELKRAKRKVLTGYIYGLESPKGQCSQMGINELLTQDANFSHKYIRRIELVTAEDIQKVAKKYLNKENLSIVTLTPQGQEVKKQSPSDKKDIKIERIKLDNGITLLMREDKRLPAVSIQACFLGGVRFEDEGNSGITNLMASMLTKGTKTLSSKQIAERLESMGASLSSYGGNNSFGASMKIMKEDLDEGFKIFSECILKPAFSNDELKIEKEKALAAIRAQREDIFRTGSKLLRETLFKVHPYRFQSIGNKESVEALTSEHLKTYHKKLAVGENMVLAVFGDAEKNDLINSINKHFKTMRIANKPILENIQEPLLENVREQNIYMPKEQTLVLFGFSGITIYDKDRHVFEVLSSILSGDAGRLFKTIRQEYGQAYTTGAYPMFGLDPGYFVIYAAIAQENAQDVKAQILNQLSLLLQEPVKDEEIDMAKKQLVSLKKMGLQTNSQLAFQCCLDELYGLGYDNYTNYSEKISAVTKGDIMRVAKKYLSPDKYAYISISPGEKE